MMRAAGREMKSTDPDALLAWMQTGVCPKACTELSAEDSIDAPVTSGNDHVDMIESEIFLVKLPLKIEAEIATGGENDRFAGFKESWRSSEVVFVDRMFVRMFDMVEAAILDGNSQRIIVDGLQPLYQEEWVSLTLQVLALKTPQKHFFLIEQFYETVKVRLHVASSSTTVYKSFSGLEEGVKFACSFDRAIILTCGPRPPMDSPQDVKPSCYVWFVDAVPKEHRRETMEAHHRINALPDEYAMTSSFSAFEYYVRDHYKDEKLKDRDLQTMYYLCSGHFETLKNNAYLITQSAENSVDCYLHRRPFDEQTIVEMGKGFLGDIQFDKIRVDTRCGKKFDMTANTFILANPTRHGEGEAPTLMGMPDQSVINFPTVFSPNNQYYYLLSPSQRVFEDAKRNPIVFENLELPQYLYEHGHLIKNKRWHLDKDDYKARIKRVKVRNKLLFSVATKILYALVETVADNPEVIKERSWHISGLYGTGKSTSLMICQSLWCQRPSRFRVVYLPYANLFESAYSFRRLFCRAFFRDPIQHLLLSIKLGNVEEMLKILESFLDSRKLFLVIIIDHLEEVWDGKKFGRYKEVQKSITHKLLELMQQGHFKRILLITASDPHCSAAQIKGHRKGQLNLEILNGFNELEARWMVNHFMTEQPAETADSILEKAKSFGVRPIENNFAVRAESLIVGCSRPDPVVDEEEVNCRIKELIKGISKRFSEFADDPSEYQKSRKFDKLLDVFYANLCKDAKLKEDDLYDKRFVKRVICPESWDAMGSRANKEKAAVGVLPLTIRDVHDYELTLCDPDFRKAFGEGTSQYCWLPCNEITSQTLHTLYMYRLHREADEKLKNTPPGSEAWLLRDALEQDIAISGMKTIYARSLTGYSNRRAQGFTISQLQALLNFAAIRKINDGDQGFGELTCAYGDHGNMDQKTRLAAIGLEPEYLYLFRMKMDFEFDFCLVQNENCFAVQIVEFMDRHLLKRRLLEAAYVLSTRRAELLPVLYGRSETAKLLFVCRKPPFWEDQPETRKKFKIVTRTAYEESTPAFYKSWPIQKLKAEVTKLLCKGHLEVHFVAINEQPVGYFEMCRHVSTERFSYDSDYYWT